jgi:hypothetical protein
MGSEHVTAAIQGLALRQGLGKCSLKTSKLLFPPVYAGAQRSHESAAGKQAFPSSPVCELTSGMDRQCRCQMEGSNTAASPSLKSTLAQADLFYVLFIARDCDGESPWEIAEAVFSGFPLIGSCWLCLLQLALSQSRGLRVHPPSDSCHASTKEVLTVKCLGCSKALYKGTQCVTASAWAHEEKELRLMTERCKLKCQLFH